jgi:hypothetical protein
MHPLHHVEDLFPPPLFLSYLLPLLLFQAVRVQDFLPPQLILITKHIVVETVEDLPLVFGWLEVRNGETDGVVRAAGGGGVRLV